MAENSYFIYDVKKNDTVTRVLNSFKLYPIYGKNASLEKTLDLNPRLKNTRGNRIYPGETLTLPLQVDTPTPILAKNLPLLRLPAEAEVSLAEDSLHHLELGIDYSFSTLSAYDPLSRTRANIYTTSHFGVFAQFHQNWSSYLKSFFKFRFEVLKFAPSSNPLKTLAQDSIQPVQFSLGINHQINENIYFSYALSYGHELFLRGLNATEVIIDTVAMPAVHVTPQFKFYNSRQTVIGLDIGGTYYFSVSNDNYEIKSGWGATATPFISYEPKENKIYKLFLSYSTRQQNTSLVDLESKETSAGISVQFNPFESDKK